MSAAGLHTVEITALSPRAELLSVLRVGAAVVVAVGAYLTLAGTRATGDRRDSSALLPYQALIQGADVADQRLFRSLQVALIEAQNLRAATGAWPDAAAMAEEGIDPFAVDPTNRGATYAWRMSADGGVISYLGLPDRAGAPAWLARIQEPEASAPPEPFQDDEEHARLPDGTLLHVSIWRHALGGRVAAAAPRLPQNDGWIQLFALGPSSLH